MVWFVATWLLVNVAESFGLASANLPEGSGPFAYPFFILEWFFIWDMPRLQRTAVGFAICVVIWPLSWIIGRMRGQPDQWNAVVAALSCGMGQWVWRAFDVLRPDEALAADSASLLNAVLVIAAFPAIIGPAVAAYLYRRKP